MKTLVDDVRTPCLERPRQPDTGFMNQRHGPRENARTGNSEGRLGPATLHERTGSPNGRSAGVFERG